MDYDMDKTPSSSSALSESADGSMIFHEDAKKSSFFDRTHDVCDVTLDLGEQQFPAHRIVLAARSPYFEALFKPSMKEGFLSTIKLNCIQPECFAVLLSFMYLGLIKITDRNVEDLLECANYLCLESVCWACGEFLLRKLAPENAFSVLRLAWMYDQHELNGAVRRYTAKHIVAIAECESFLEISPKDLEFVLQEEEFVATRGKYENFLSPEDAEYMLAGVILKYILHDRDSRLQYLGRMLGFVRLGSLQGNMLLDLKKQVLCIGGSCMCDDLFTNTTKRVKVRIAAEYSLTAGPRYGFMERDPNIPYFMRPSNAPICGMDITICNWFCITDNKYTLVLAGLRIYFSDGHVDEIGAQEGYQQYGFRLRDGEKIVAAQVKASLLVDKLVFWTNHGNVLGPFGGLGGQKRDKEAPVRQDDDGYLGGLSCLKGFSNNRVVLCNLSFKWLKSQHPPQGCTK